MVKDKPGIALANVAEILADRVDCMRGARRPVHGRSAIFHEPIGPMDMLRFDVTLANGRVYRVRVSDITPIEEPAA